MIFSRKPARVLLSLGSNIEPERNLPAAVRELAVHGTIAGVSSVWQTAPVGFTEQPDFLNAAVLLESDLSIDELRNTVIPRIETKLGRVRNPHNKNAARTIDVDISLYDRVVVESHGRNIPDPEILERAFVAGPLAELDPEFLHPVTGETLREIAERLIAKSPPMQLRADVQLLDADE